MVVCHQSSLSSGWCVVWVSVIRAVCHQGGVLSGWYVIRAVCHQGGVLSGWYVIRAVCHQGGVLSGWYVIRVVCCQGGMSSEQSVIRVICHQSSLSSEQSVIRVVYHQSSLSSCWSVIRVVCHQSGLSSGWSVIKAVCHLGSLSGWSVIRAVCHQGCLCPTVLSVWQHEETTFWLRIRYSVNTGSINFFQIDAYLALLSCACFLFHYYLYITVTAFIMLMFSVPLLPIHHSDCFHYADVFCSITTYTSQWLLSLGWCFLFHYYLYISVTAFIMLMFSVPLLPIHLSDCFHYADVFCSITTYTSQWLLSLCWCT